jgi:hypothetical protein
MIAVALTQPAAAVADLFDQDLAGRPEQLRHFSCQQILQFNRREPCRSQAFPPRAVRILN